MQLAKAVELPVLSQFGRATSGLFESLEEKQSYVVALHESIQQQLEENGLGCVNEFVNDTLEDVGSEFREELAKVEKALGVGFLEQKLRGKLGDDGDVSGGESSDEDGGEGEGEGGSEDDDKGGGSGESEGASESDDGSTDGSDGGSDDEDSDDPDAPAKKQNRQQGRRRKKKKKKKSVMPQKNEVVKRSYAQV
jgi:hypothetical protein